SKLSTARIPAYVCVAWYPSDCIECLNEKPVAEYISLSEVDRYDAKSLLLASSAMPYIYPPELIHDKIYRDGGLADNVPVLPMTCIGANKLIVVKLEPDDKVDTSLYSHFSEVVEIVPSREIGDMFDGTLEFGTRNVPFRMLLGYYDTLRAFNLRMYKLNGLPLSEAEKKRREDEDYEKIMSILRRERTLGSAENNMSRLNSLLNKFEN
ncbi:MAG: patatin-like phospholipase family protein, partial [Lachnospiraceae bacterium]